MKFRKKARKIQYSMAFGNRADIHDEIFNYASNENYSLIPRNQSQTFSDEPSIEATRTSTEKLINEVR